MGYSRFGRNLSEQKEEYLSLFLSSAQIQETTSAREGFPLPTNVVAQGLPFCFNGHQDENGYYLGDTASTSVEPGTLLWNPFYKDRGPMELKCTPLNINDSYRGLLRK